MTVTHPQPELAIKLAVEWMDATFTGRLLMSAYRLNQVAVTDEELVREFTQAFACYNSEQAFENVTDMITCP